MAHDGHAAKPVILVVDDSPDNLTVAAAALADHYRVLLANSAKRGLEIARGDVRPDMILLDVMMPEMDGYEVCTKLKQTPETGDIPVIFLTSSADSDNERRGLELGAVDYVTKPFEPRLLLARVKAHLSVRAQADSRVARAISADHEVATRKLAAILSTTSDGFWTVTRDGYITSANVGYCQQLGYEVAAVVGQRVDDDRRISACLDDFVEITNRTGLHRAGQRTVMPDGLRTLDQKTPDQIGTGQVFVTGNGHQRTLQLVGHVFKKAGFAATGRPLQHDRQTLAISRLEDRHFIALRLVIRRDVARLGQLQDIVLNTTHAFGSSCHKHSTSAAKGTD